MLRHTLLQQKRDSTEAELSTRDSLNQGTTAIPDCTPRAVVNNDFTHLQAVVSLSLSCEVLCQVTKSLSTLDTLHSMFYYTSLSACALQTYNLCSTFVIVQAPLCVLPRVLLQYFFSVHIRTFLLSSCYICYNCKSCYATDPATFSLHYQSFKFLVGDIISPQD